MLSVDSSVRRAAKASGGALLLWAAVEGAGVLLDRRPMALVAVQAALAQWGADRLGVAWSADDEARSPAGLTRRIALGVVLGAGAALAVTLVAWASGGARATPGSTSLGLLLLGLVTSVLGATRDELVLRGAVLRASSALPPWAALIVCGAVGVAARLGLDGEWSSAVVAEGLRAVALAAMWSKDRGAWLPWAANAAWTWTLGPLSHGGPLDIRFTAEAAAGPSALAVLAAAAAGAIVWARETAGCPITGDGPSPR